MIPPGEFSRAGDRLEMLRCLDMLSQAVGRETGNPVGVGKPSARARGGRVCEIERLLAVAMEKPARCDMSAREIVSGSSERP